MVAPTRNPNILEAETEVSSNKASLGYIVRPVKTNKQTKTTIFSIKVKPRFTFLQPIYPGAVYK